MHTTLLYGVLTLTTLGSFSLEASSKDKKITVAKKMTAEQELVYARELLKRLAPYSKDLVLYIAALTETQLNIRKLTVTVFENKVQYVRTSTLVPADKSTLGERFLNTDNEETMKYEQVVPGRPTILHTLLLKKFYEQCLALLPPTHHSLKKVPSHKSKESPDTHK